jgi:shikimate dehydrogenase
MIDSTTDLVAILGSPIQQVKSPQNFNTYFRDNSLNLAMIAVDLEEAAVGDFIRAMRGWKNLRGCIITVPYKRTVMTLLDSVSARAKLLGAVNVVRRESDGRLTGDMVDGNGFLKALRRNGFEPRSKRALLVGAGGAGSAIAHALCEAGINHLTIIDTNIAGSKRLIDLLHPAFPVVELAGAVQTLNDFDLVVNATPIGMNDREALPIPKDLMQSLTSNCLVADVITSPALTPFLSLALQLNCKVQSGTEMALAQFNDLANFMGIMPNRI